MALQRFLAEDSSDTTFRIPSTFDTQSFLLAETGEQFFSPETVERLQQMILDEKNPDHFIRIPVYDFAA